eukprot:9495052-Pyramimonas_sp.AAC.1
MFGPTSDLTFGGRRRPGADLQRVHEHLEGLRGVAQVDVRGEGPVHADHRAAALRRAQVQPLQSPHHEGDFSLAKGLQRGCQGGETRSEQGAGSSARRASARDIPRTGQRERADEGIFLGPAIGRILGVARVRERAEVGSTYQVCVDGVTAWEQNGAVHQHACCGI